MGPPDFGGDDSMELEVANQQAPVAKHVTSELSSKEPNVDFMKRGIEDLSHALSTVLLFGLKYDSTFKGTLTHIDATVVLDY